MKRHASAVWMGDLLTGQGVMNSQSGAFTDLKYSFKTRFQDEPGTNPEELIGAAHAGCFSMAFANELTTAGFAPQEVATKATVTLDKGESGFSISAIHLDVEVRVLGPDEDSVRSIAIKAKSGCPVSKVLNAKITIELTIIT